MVFPTIFVRNWYQNVQLVIRLIQSLTNNWIIAPKSQSSKADALGASAWRCKGVVQLFLLNQMTGCVYVQILLVHGTTLVLLWRYNFIDCILTNPSTTVTRISSFIDSSIEVPSQIFTPCSAAWLTISEASSASIKSHIQTTSYVNDTSLLHR